MYFKDGSITLKNYYASGHWADIQGVYRIESETNPGNYEIRATADSISVEGSDGNDKIITNGELNVGKYVTVLPGKGDDSVNIGAVGIMSINTDRVTATILL